MNVFQVWMLIGLPALALAAAMFIRRSSWRAYVGYGALILGFAGMAVYDRMSAGVFGGLAALSFAAGRGGSIERVDLRENEQGVPDGSLTPARRSGST